MPSLLSRCAAIVPATCVPWPWLSCGSLSGPGGAVALGDADARVLRDEVPAVPVVAVAVAVVVDAVGALVAPERVGPGLPRVVATWLTRSGCVISRPVSTIPTVTPAPVAFVQASGTSMSASAVPGRVVAAAAGDEHLLAGVLEAPQRAEVRVGALRGLHGDRLGVDDVRVAVELGDGLGQVARVRAHDLGVRRACCGA